MFLFCMAVFFFCVAVFGCCELRFSIYIRPRQLFTKGVNAKSYPAFFFTIIHYAKRK
jgi:hypothetical protein